DRLAGDAEEQRAALAEPSRDRTNGESLRQGDERAEQAQRNADLGRGPVEAILDEEHPDRAVGLADETDKQEHREQWNERAEGERPAERHEGIQRLPIDRLARWVMRFRQNEECDREVEAIQRGSGEERIAQPDIAEHAADDRTQDEAGPEEGM